MSDDVAGPVGRRPTFGYLVVQFLLIVFTSSCAGFLGGSSPTAPAPPSFPDITPIMPRREPTAPSEPTPTSAPAAEPSPVNDESGTGTDKAAEGTTDPSEYTVQPGDTLLGIAKQYGVPMAAIQLENDMGESTVVQAGQTLSVPPQEEWEDLSPYWIVHEVEPGETLIGIARVYDLEPERLQAINGLDDADQITVGQLLILPLRGPTAAPRSSERGSAPAAAAADPTTVPEPTATSQQESATPTTSSVESGPQPAAEPPPELATWPERIAELINEVRARHGLAPYAYNVILEQAAQAHANDCSQRGWCSHTGSGGTDVKARVIRAGYDPTGWAECWAQTQTPERAVKVWMNETPPNDPHRRTLLSDWFSEIGLGVAEADWGYYIIADFGRP